MMDDERVKEPDSHEVAAKSKYRDPKFFSFQSKILKNQSWYFDNILSNILTAFQRSI